MARSPTRCRAAAAEHPGPAPGLDHDLGQDPAGVRVALVVQVGDAAATVVVADHAGEGHHGAGRGIGDLVGHLGLGQCDCADERVQSSWWRRQSMPARMPID